MIFLKKHHSKNDTLRYLLEFGAHIGDMTNYCHFDHDLFINIFCIRNNFYIFDLTKTAMQFQRSLMFVQYLALNFGKLLFYHSDIESYFFKFIFFFLIQSKTSNSFISSKLKGGFISNYKQCFLKYINILSNIPLRVRSKRYLRKKYTVNKYHSYLYSSSYHRYLFLKFMLLIFEKSLLKRDWESEFKKLLLFWRSFLFIRSFKSIFQLPDCLICINPSNDWFVVNEYSKTNKLPSIGIVDTSTSSSNCTYIIACNDDSIPLSLFFITVFLNIWLISRSKLTNNIINL